VRRIVDAGEALRGRRSGRVRMFAVAAAAAALVGGGAVAATVLDLPSGGNDASSAAGEAAEGAVDDSGGGDGSVPRPDSGTDTSEEGAMAEDADGLVVLPDVASPGAVVRLDVPPDVAFGAEWSLERSVDAAWEPAFILVDADVAAERGAALSVPADATRTLPDFREVQDGPVPLVVPDDAQPGSYRICQLGDDGTDWCGGLTVTG
jgi:hypothetical protein